ncbi:cysteine peptidase family C39 domain-containing protein [Methanothermobacter marburgensis]|uniref:cysteine peptidase family C39 domain-containing protein n=1 Tax=Methanothermobacter marburgensis TaxID=145263 RepID=UPI0035B8B56E
MKLNITELRGNMIAYTVSDGKGHYTLIREVTSNTVKLADPTQGNIEIPLEEFQKIYTGYTLTTTNQTETTENTTQTENQTNPEKPNRNRAPYKHRKNPKHRGNAKHQR